VKSNAWTRAAERQLRWIYPRMSTPECAASLGRSVKAVRTRAKLLGIKKGDRRPWTTEENALLRARYPDTSTKDIAKELGRPLFTIYQHARVLGLAKSEAYMASPAACRLRRGDHIGKAFQFPKGHVPANKGTRRPGWFAGRMRETQFKKGQRSRNVLPIGTIHADHDGYLRKKIRDGIGGTGNPLVWELVHKRTWIDAHGPIPAGHMLRFRDGNKNNCALANLELITFAENCRRNSIHNLPPELKQVIQLTGAVKRHITMRSKKNVSQEPDPRPARPPVRDTRSA
jgi:hypothetical protein